MRDVHKLARANVLRMSASERQKEDQMRTLVDVLKTSASERYTADQIRTSSERPPANVTPVSHCKRKQRVFFSAPMLTDESVHTARRGGAAARSRSGSAAIVSAPSLFLLRFLRSIKVTGHYL